MNKRFDSEQNEFLYRSLLMGMADPSEKYIRFTTTDEPCPFNTGWVDSVISNALGLNAKLKKALTKALYDTDIRNVKVIVTSVLEDSKKYGKRSSALVSNYADYLVNRLVGVKSSLIKDLDKRYDFYASVYNFNALVITSPRVDLNIKEYGDFLYTVEQRFWDEIIDPADLEYFELDYDSTLEIIYLILKDSYIETYNVLFDLDPWLWADVVSELLSELNLLSSQHKDILKLIAKYPLDTRKLRDHLIRLVSDGEEILNIIDADRL